MINRGDAGKILYRTFVPENEHAAAKAALEKFKKSVKEALRNGGYVSVGSWAAPFYTLFAQFMTSTHAKRALRELVILWLHFLNSFRIFAAFADSAIFWPNG